MTQQIEQSREKLNRSRTERESQAAQRELEELRKLIRDREDEIQRIDNDTAAVRTQVDATDAEHKELAAELAAKEGDINAKVTQLESDRAAKGGGRDSIVKRSRRRCIGVTSRFAGSVEARSRKPRTERATAATWPWPRRCTTASVVSR